MIKVGLSFVAAYLLLGAVAVALFLFVVPVGTTKVIYAAIPSALFGPSIREAAALGRFTQASDLLAQQANLSEQMGLNDTMKQNLVSQSFEVVDRARNRNQFEDLLAWLERLDKISPNSLLANLMLSDAKIRSGHLVEELKLRKIREIVPSLDTIYRAAIEQSVRQQNTSSIGKWCKMYQGSQLGALNPQVFNPSRVMGQGLSGFFLEVIDRQGRVVAGANYSIQLNERRGYEFESHNLPEQSQLIIQLPTLPGLKITVHNVKFVARGTITSYPGEDLLLLPKRGFILDKNQSLITSPSGDTLFMYPMSGRFPPSDKVVLELEFVKLALFNHSMCIAGER